MNVGTPAGAMLAGQHIEVTKFRSGVLRLWSGDDHTSQPEPKEPGPNPSAANVENTLTPEVRRRQARLERAVIARLEHEQPIVKGRKASSPASPPAANPKYNLIALAVDGTLGLIFKPSSSVPKVNGETSRVTDPHSRSSVVSNPFRASAGAADASDVHGNTEISAPTATVDVNRAQGLGVPSEPNWIPANENQAVSRPDIFPTSTVVALAPVRQALHPETGESADVRPYGKQADPTPLTHRLDLVA